MSDYRVEIIRKNIRNTYLRVRSDGTVTVTCPKHVSEKQVHEFIEKKDRWIRRQLEKTVIEDENMSLDGRCAMYFGREVKIRTVKTNFTDAYEKDGVITVMSPDDSPEEHCRIITEMYSERFSDYAGPALKRCLDEARRLGVSKRPGLRVRLMKSRYGSYSARTGMISLNLYLARFSPEVIDSVIYHEIAHTRHMNHQRGFYSLLYRLCPDYDRLSYCLKKDGMKPLDRWFLK